MILADKQIIKLKNKISKMSLPEVWEYRQRISMSDIDQSQVNVLHGYLNDRADRLDRNNALLVRSEIDDDM